jgi:hypothetical protein
MEQVFNDVPDKEQVYKKTLQGYERIKYKTERTLVLLKEKKRNTAKDFIVSALVSSITLITLLNAIHEKEIFWTLVLIMFLSFVVSIITYKKFSDKSIEEDIDKTKIQLENVNNAIKKIKD